MEIPEDPLYLKVAALITLLGIAVFGGAVPIYWKRLRDSPLALSHLNVFSAGVFISMAFNHLLPDADEAFRSLNLSFKQIAFTLAMSGYAFILWIEMCIVDAHALVHEHTETGHCDEHHLSDQISSANSPTLAIFAVPATSAHYVGILYYAVFFVLHQRYMIMLLDLVVSAQGFTRFLRRRYPRMGCWPPIHPWRYHIRQQDDAFFHTHHFCRVKKMRSATIMTCMLCQRHVRVPRITMIRPILPILHKVSRIQHRVNHL